MRRSIHEVTFQESGLWTWNAGTSFRLRAAFSFSATTPPSMGVSFLWRGGAVPALAPAPAVLVLVLVVVPGSDLYSVLV